MHIPAILSLSVILFSSSLFGEIITPEDIFTMDEDTHPCEEIISMEDISTMDEDPCPCVEIISSEDISTMREDPRTCYEVFQKNRDILPPELEEKLSEIEQYIVFCSIAAHHMAPYGDCAETNVPAMLHSPYLHCGKYGLVTMYLAEQGLPIIDQMVKVHAVGWYGGFMGNHQTLFIYRTFDDGIFLDPTCAIVALASFNDVCSGKPISKKKIFRFSQRNDLYYFWPKVEQSLYDGLCRPSQLCGYYNSVFDCKEWFENYYISPRWVPTPAFQNCYLQSVR